MKISSTQDVNRIKIESLLRTNAQSADSNLSPPENTKNIAFPANGWGTSLAKGFMFTRAEIEKHVGNSGKKYRNSEHHSLPTGLQKAKAFLADEYLHNKNKRTVIKGIFITVLSVFIVSRSMKHRTT